MNINDFTPAVTSQRLNNLMQSRFGFKLDYSQLTIGKARELELMVSENLARIRHSFGVHQAERNPRYMELLMIRESLNNWLNETQQLMESEIGKSEAILAAKDMVDSIQDMVEKVSKMQVEQLPALIDTIRDQIGMAEADQFKSAMGDLLQNISQSLSQARETADSSARTLAGEEGGMGGMGNVAGTAGAEMPGAAPGLGEPSDMDQDVDAFGATDAAAGGTEPVGRERR